MTSMFIMEYTRAQMTYATALNRNELYATPALSRDIPRVLRDDDEVLLALPGVASDFPKVFIVTRDRFIKAKVSGPIRKAAILREVPASQVTAVRFKPGIFTRIHVQVSGGRDIAMLPHTKEDTQRFVEEFSHLLRTGRLPGQ